MNFRWRSGVPNQSIATPIKAMINIIAAKARNVSGDDIAPQVDVYSIIAHSEIDTMATFLR